jgi:hypothetical protein
VAAAAVVAVAGREKGLDFSGELGWRDLSSGDDINNRIANRHDMSFN